MSKNSSRFLKLRPKEVGRRNERTGVSPTKGQPSKQFNNFFPDPVMGVLYMMYTKL